MPLDPMKYKAFFNPNPNFKKKKKTCDVLSLLQSFSA